MNITQSVIELSIPAEKGLDKISNEIVIRNLSGKPIDQLPNRLIFVKISARLKTFETYTAREIKLH